MDEATYNQAAAAAGGLLVLDRKTVRVTKATTPVEVCDLLSPERHLVHVKRKLGSSVLSHLFAQGFVSADLLMWNEEFRQCAAEKVGEALDDGGGGDDADRRQFEVFGGGFDPSDFEVVYAIIGDWQGREFVDRLPFFSKVNLRRCVQDLGRRQFRVTHKRVRTVGPRRAASA